MCIHKCRNVSENITYKYRLERLMGRISPFMKTFVLFLIYYSGLYFIFNSLFSQKGLYIVGYHRISENIPAEDVHVLAVTQKNLAAHFRYYNKQYEVITLDQAALLLKEEKLRKNFMIITFDDGYRDNFTLGQALFKQYEIPATLFLTASPIEKRQPLWTDVIDQLVFSSKLESVGLEIYSLKGEFRLIEHHERVHLSEMIKNEIKRYDEQIKRQIIKELISRLEVEMPTSDALMISWDEVLQLMEVNVQMGSHTMHHPTLSAISLQEAAAELADSKTLIERRINQDVRHFAYPYGRSLDYNAAVKQEVSKIYSTAVTAINGINYPGHDLWELDRVIVENISVQQLRFRLLKLKIKSYFNKNRR
jgi:peptidoglycan/xylan/chitin deacetylase (PgdA/CDA1 family)